MPHDDMQAKAEAEAAQAKLLAAKEAAEKDREEVRKWHGVATTALSFLFYVSSLTLRSQLLQAQQIAEAALAAAARHQAQVEEQQRAAEAAAVRHGN